MKKLWLVSILSIFTLGIFAPATALAGSISDEIITIASDEIVEDTVYAAANRIDVKGVIDGDLIAAASQIAITGTVKGDVIIVAGQVDITGTVEGDVRVAGGDATINGVVDQNATVFGGNITFGENASIGRDILIAGGVVNTYGTVGRNALIAGNALFVNSTIGGKLTMYQDGNDLGPAIGSSADIAGDLTYTSNLELDFEDGSVVAGEITQLFPQTHAKEEWNKVLGMGMLLGLIIKLFGVWLVGLVVVYLCKDKMPKCLKSIKEESLKNLGWGFVVMFLGPIVLLVLTMTIIGIPLAMILLAFWIMALYISKIIVGIFVGDYLINNISKEKSKKKSQDYRSRMILGTSIIVLISMVPVIGWIVGFFVTLIGLGTLWVYLKKEKLNA